MIIELVDESRLLITLAPADMQLLDISFEQLDWRDCHSKKVMKELILLAQNETGFTADGHKLLIEALPEGGGGCRLWVTLLPGEAGKTRKKFRIKGRFGPYVYQFDSAEQLLNALAHLKAAGSRPSCPNSLIAGEKSYRLVFYPLGTLAPAVDAVLSEYGRLKGRGTIAAAAAAEHGTLLAEHNAVEAVGRYLS